MGWNVTSCSDWRLYVILDRAAAGSRELTALAAQAIRGGADVLQLRDKAASARALLEEARRLLPITRQAGIPLIINDRVDVARASKADGVHLGQEDLPLQEARAILGDSFLIGKSTHSLDQARTAMREGADYLAIGPVFATPTKPDYPCVGAALISQVSAIADRPLVCIGGIDQTNVSAVLEAGGRCVAVVRAVCAAPAPEAATRMLKSRLTKFVPTPAR